MRSASEIGFRSLRDRLNHRRQPGSVQAALGLLVLCLFVQPLVGVADVGAQDSDGEEIGLEVYESMCSGCHQDQGRGVPGMFPTLRGNSAVQGPPMNLIRLIFEGRGAMPGFADRLSDREVAAVVSYLRTNWENRAPPVTIRIVTGARDGDSPEATDGGRGTMGATGGRSGTRGVGQGGRGD